MTLTWDQVYPTGYWLLVKADKDQTQTQGGILLTQRLGGEATFGYYTGKVLRYGDQASEFLNCNRDEKITHEEFTSEKIIYKNYLSDTVKFLYKDHEDHKIFMLNIADPNLNIVGLCNGNEVVELL